MARGGQQVGDRQEEAGVLAAQCRNPVIFIRRGNRRGDSSSRVEGYVAEDGSVGAGCADCARGQRWMDGGG